MDKFKSDVNGAQLDDRRVRGAAGLACRGFILCDHILCDMKRLFAGAILLKLPMISGGDIAGGRFGSFGLV